MHTFTCRYACMCVCSHLYFVCQMPYTRRRPWRHNYAVANAFLCSVSVQFVSFALEFVFFSSWFHKFSIYKHVIYVYSPPNLCVVDICENTYSCCSSFPDTIIVYYLFFSPPATCSSAALAVFTYLFLNVHYSQFNTSLHAMLISNPILDPHLEDVCARATLLCSVHDDDLISTVALRLFYIYRQRKPTPFLTLYLWRRSAHPTQIESKSLRAGEKINLVSFFLFCIFWTE